MVEGRALGIVRRAGASGTFVHGPDLRVARGLVAVGIGALEDNGDVKIHGRVDRERWLFKVRPEVTISEETTGVFATWPALL